MAAAVLSFLDRDNSMGYLLKQNGEVAISNVFSVGGSLIDLGGNRLER